jgi:hypothetical protein
VILILLVACFDFPFLEHFPTRYKNRKKIAHSFNKLFCFFFGFSYFVLKLTFLRKFFSGKLFSN